MTRQTLTPLARSEKLFIEERAKADGFSGFPYLYGYCDVDPAIIGDLTIEEIGKLIQEIITFHHHCERPDIDAEEGEAI